MGEVIKAEYSGKRNLSGERFHWLTVTGYAGYKLDGEGKKLWMCECRCKCGKTTVCQQKGLISGNTKSCGCWQKRRASESNKTHGKSKTRLYFVWQSMIKRCSPSATGKDKKDYFDRGIRVCERWARSFEAFVEDMGEPPIEGASIERKDNDEGYSPENCKWATSREQSRNTRRNILLTFNGKTQALRDWAEEIGIHPTTLRDRIKKLNWTPEEALSVPVNPSNSLRKIRRAKDGLARVQ